MSALAIAAICLACVFGGALGGRYLRSLLPDHHLSSASKDIVMLAIGVIATMAALVLGLLVSSAKATFDKTGDELTAAASKVVQLDRVLAQYGPDSSAVRSQLRANFKAVTSTLTSQDSSAIAQLQAPVAGGRVADLAVGIRALVPGNDEQRDLRNRALTLAEGIGEYRILLLLQQHDSISTPLLVVVVAWLALIFVGFGMFSPPRNATVVTALFLCAMSVSGAIFIILEMDDPLSGMVRVSATPMRSALAILAHD